MRVLACLFSVLLLASCSDESEATVNEPGPQTSVVSPYLGQQDFDFYVLALSWSPGYCRSEGDRANQQQCDRADPFGFVVHGLWPQFDDGYPEFCGSNEGSSVPREIQAEMFDIMPSRGLINHQWKKHGTCTGLPLDVYFDATRVAFEEITIPDAFLDRSNTTSIDPDDVETAFRDADPELAADEIAVTCDRRFLRDVRICMSKTLDEFVSCPQVDRRSCRRETVVVPPN